MKKMLSVLLLAALMVFAFASVAMAAEGDAVYEAPTPGVSPHGGYTDSTNKCAVCHSVHHASDLGGEEMLLRSSVANACIYCHVSSNFAIKTVYSETPSLYSVAVDNRDSHDTSGFGGSFKCGSCHAVHGAGMEGVAGTDYTAAKILKAPTGAFTYDTTDNAVTFGGAEVITGATNQDLNLANMTDAEEVNAWCTRCHKYWNTSYNQDTHVMKAPGDGTQYGLAASPASATSALCRSCHNGGYTDVDWDGATWSGKDATGAVVDLTAAYAGENNWPHNVSGDRLIGGLADGGASLDEACLDCHAGVATNF